MTYSKLLQLITNYKQLIAIAALIILFFVIPPFFTSQTLKTSPQQKVLISQIINHPALDATLKGIIDGLQQGGYVKGKNLILEVAVAQGKMDTSIQIAQKFAGNNPDVIVGISTPSAQTAAFAAKTQNIPVVFSSVTYPVLSKLVDSIQHPGKNVTGVSNFTEIKDHFVLFQKLLPNLKRLGIIYNPGEINSAIMVEQAKAIGQQMGIEIIVAPAIKTADVGPATLKLVGKVEAIFINNDNTALGAFGTIIKNATINNIPILVSDTDMIEEGALAALGTNQYLLGMQTAKMIIRILKGEKPRAIPVEFAKELEVKINLKVARKLGIAIPDEVLKTAITVDK